MKTISISAAAVLAGFLAACGAAQATPVTPTPVIGKITFAGSTTIQPLIAKIADAYKTEFPGITLDIAAGGSLVGIQALHDGAVDIGMSSRDLTEEERKGIIEHPIAMDAIVIIVNPSNPVTNITMADLAAVYMGEKTNWSELGGLDLPILPITRETSSGTRGAFDELALHKKEPAAEALETAVTAGDVVARVAVEAGSIGYIGFGNIDPSIRVLAVDGVIPNRVTVSQKQFPLVRPLILLTGPLTQPIALDFIAYVLGPKGQRLVEDFGWVPLG